VRATIPDCSAIRALARAARPGEALVAASAPPSATFNAPIALMRPAWPPDGERPGLLFMSTPGRITGRITAPTAGRYVVWVQGSFGRPLEVRVDGHRVGQVQGTNTPRGWLAAGSIRLGSGGHNVQLVRSGGGLAPGDGARSSVGPVALMQPGEDKLVRVAPRDARRLCGHPWDWVERVSGGPPAS
jgi:hypothetical protein